MKNILITCPLPLEFNEARNQLGLKEITTKKEHPRIAKGKGIILILSGIGKINSIISVNDILKKLENKPDIVIDTGTCGAISKDIKIFDLVTSITAIDYYNIDMKGLLIKNCNIELLNDIIPKLNIGRRVVSSIENSINKEEMRDKLYKKGSDIVTWETSAIFSLCKKENIPFVSIRVVSDNCNQDTYEDFKVNALEGCKKLYNYIKNICSGI